MMEQFVSPSGILPIWVKVEWPTYPCPLVLKVFYFWQTIIGEPSSQFTATSALVYMRSARLSIPSVEKNWPLYSENDIWLSRTMAIPTGERCCLYSNQLIQQAHCFTLSSIRSKTLWDAATLRASKHCYAGLITARTDSAHLLFGNVPDSEPVGETTNCLLLILKSLYQLALSI